MTPRTKRTLRARLGAWWRGLPLMRAFACYTVICILAAGVVSLVAIEALMTAYDHLDYERNAERLVVDSGPYVYDAATDELVPAVSIDLSSGFGDRILFLGLRGGTGRASVEVSGRGAGVYLADTGQKVVYATLDMLRDDATLSIMDWGANYVEEDYAEAGGNPYNPVPLAVGDLASYDARERAERAQVTDELGDTIGRLDAADDDVLVSNVAYYVAQSAESAESLLMLGLRLAAGFSPFVVLGVFAVIAFRRFYRMRLAEPLGALHAAADRIAVQDLDFTVDEVRGREFGRLAEAFERMRGSLERAQSELWETAEARRRLNAAFAHDLRTPVTVLKGTLEMARALDAPAEEPGQAPGGARVVPDTVLDTLTAQVSRLEAYAQAMTGVTKLEDRPVRPEPIAFAELGDELVQTARPMVERAGLRLEVRTTDERDVGAPRTGVREGAGPTAGVAASGEAPLMVDVALADEVLGNMVSNASRYAEHVVALELRAYTRDGGAWLSLTVADDGPGFSSEALHHGCDAFFGEAKSAEHFGLGLAIASTLTRLHSGSIELANGPSGGARVTATLEAGARDAGAPEPLPPRGLAKS